MQPGRVLLIHPHTLFRNLLVRFLEDLPGVEVVAEASTLEAFSPAVLSHPIDLLIVSEEFLRLNTADILPYLNPPSKAPALLVIATTDQAQLINEAAARGIPGFIMQQSDLQTLAKALEAVLQGRTYYCPIAARLLAENLVSKGALQPPRLTPREQAVLRGKRWPDDWD